MLKWLFGNRSEATVSNDCVWISEAARTNGLQAEVSRLVGAGRNVMVVAPSKDTFSSLLAAFTAHQPARCQNVFDRDALLRRFGETPTVAVALADALPHAAKPPRDIRLEILVYGRNMRRSADDTIVHFANVVGPGARVTFHLTLDDPLLRKQSDRLKPLIEKLRIPENEPISHPFVSKAIAQAQSK